jgi:SAM-dependent methyltransferase
MVHHSICPLCSSEKIRLHFECKDYFISKDVFPVFSCTDCNFLFTQDYPGETDIAQYYESDDYISHSDISTGFANKLYRLVRSFMLLKKKALIENITGLKRGNLLDVGSGTGYFAHSMKEGGWSVTGIEINEKARIFAFKQFRLETASPENIPDLKSNSFDCITLWHVLEHFHDPFRYISEIYRLLKPGAVCIIALPNCSSYDANYYKKFWAAWDVPRHLWHFNPSTFFLFSKKTGFSLQKLRSLPLDVYYISILSEKNKGSSISFVKGMTKAAWFACLSFFNKKGSSSIIYVLRKP